MQFNARRPEFITLIFAHFAQQNLAFFCPPHPNGFGFPSWRGVFTKLEYLILNHLAAHRKSLDRKRLLFALAQAPSGHIEAMLPWNLTSRN